MLFDNFSNKAHLEWGSGYVNVSVHDADCVDAQLVRHKIDGVQTVF